jgi:hypothetical protein
MAIYTVLTPRGAETPDPLSVVFVKEGFAWPALFFSVLWLIFRRRWFVLIAYLVIGGAVGAVAAAISPSFVVVVLILFQFLFALEANELRRWTLAHHGYEFAGVVEGRGLEEAEIRFFATRTVPSAPAAEPSPPPPPAPVPPAPPPPQGAILPSAEAGDVVGLFPAPGARP